MGGAISLYDRLTKLRDFPSTLAGTALKPWRTNAAETALEPYTPGDAASYETRLGSLDYPAYLDGNCAFDGNMTAGSNVLTFTSSAPLTINDEGKDVVVNNAGGSGAELISQINSVSSPSQCTLIHAAGATVTGQPVSWGHDDTTVTNLMISDLSTAGGGKGIVPVKRVFTLGALQLKEYVTLAGDSSGAADYRQVNPGRVTVAPTFMITHRDINTPFIQAGGRGAGTEDLLFYYPNQAHANEAAPKAYGVTISTKHFEFPTKGVNGFHCRRCHFVNSYDGIYMFYGGRHDLERIKMGAINKGVIADWITDYSLIGPIEFLPFWMEAYQVGWSSGLEAWSFANGIALQLYYADHLSIRDFGIFRKAVGIQMDDSVSTPTAPRNSAYGVMYNIGLDMCAVGIKANTGLSGFDLGWDIHGLYANANGGTVVQCNSGGSGTPKIMVHGGAVWGGSSNPFVRNAGYLKVNDVKGYNPVGAGISAPSVPVSGVTYTNWFPVACRVHVYGGTVSAIAISGGATGLTSGSFVLDVGESITITYSSSPSWTWFGL